MNDLNRKYFLHGLVAFMLFVCSSCMPYHFTSRPGAIGTVIDAENSQPIEGATVGLDVMRSIEHKGEYLSTTTGADGKFQIPAAQRWSLYMVPLDPAPLSVLITIKKLGYEEFTKEIGTHTMGTAITDLGNVSIRKK